MEITWHGYSCFTIKTGTATVAVNPYTEKKGLILPKLKADIAVITGAIGGNNNVSTLWGEPYMIDWPGEFEVKDVAVTALPTPEGKGFIFNLMGDGMKICFIEKAGSELGDELIDKIGDVDILIISVGGGEGMTAETAQKIIEKIEPRAVVPMYYAIEGASEKLDSLDAFLKIAGITAAEPLEKLSLSGKAGMKEDQTEYFVLKAQTA